MQDGYTHASYIYAGDILKNVTSYDFTSAYSYILVTHRFPSSKFREIKIKNVNQLSRYCAYILVVKFYNIKSKYFTSYISMSQCHYIKKGRYDNGRIIEAEELEICVTDVDFRLILDMYNCEYEIIESYYANTDYLPLKFINFVLEKYVNKTKYKGLKGYEVEYAKEKNKFNSLYGMSVTNVIRDEIIYKNEDGQFYNRELTNEEIEIMLEKEESKGFLSFSYGVWVTAYARNNLLRNVIKCDDYVVYCDTDSMKLVERIR